MGKGALQSTVISVLFLFHGAESEGKRPLGPENMFVCPVFCVQLQFQCLC